LAAKLIIKLDLTLYRGSGERSLQAFPQQGPGRAPAENTFLYVYNLKGLC